ncbi:hypothetical protein CSKR_113193 [Clonorchis sinensis]|uniref:Uncharacterized protein n=1 Tax=Clonorchis sinensis TaxID=79923 RepID=A0A419Q7H3_CLOSI|nr:hypothetical protein CSKR_113193 [Clonorchis sinensis]
MLTAAFRALAASGDGISSVALETPVRCSHQPITSNTITRRRVRKSPLPFYEAGLADKFAFQDDNYCAQCIKLPGHKVQLWITHPSLASDIRAQTPFVGALQQRSLDTSEFSRPNRQMRSRLSGVNGVPDSSSTRCDHRLTRLSGNPSQVASQTIKTPLKQRFNPAVVGVFGSWRNFSDESTPYRESTGLVFCSYESSSSGHIQWLSGVLTPGNWHAVERFTTNLLVTLEASDSLHLNSRTCSRLSHLSGVPVSSSNNDAVTLLVVKID